MKVGIVGCRSYTNYEEFCDLLFDYLPSNVTTVVSGGAIGTDSMAADFADEVGLTKLIFEPDWYKPDGTFDRYAGFARNTVIVDNSDIVIAYWNGITTGTGDTITKARRANKLHKVFTI